MSQKNIVEEVISQQQRDSPNKMQRKPSQFLLKLNSTTNQSLQKRQSVIINLLGGNFELNKLEKVKCNEIIEDRKNELEGNGTPINSISAQQIQRRQSSMIMLDSSQQGKLSKAEQNRKSSLELVDLMISALQKPKRLRNKFDEQNIISSLQEFSYIKKMSKQNYRLSEQLSHILEYQYVEQGKTIFFQGEKPEYLYIIINGKVAVLVQKSLESLLMDQQCQSPNVQRRQLIIQMIQDKIELKPQQEQQQNQDKPQNYINQILLHNLTGLKQQQQKLQQQNLGDEIMSDQMPVPLKKLQHIDRFYEKGVFKHILVKLITYGNQFGEMGLLLKQPRSATILAIENTHLALVSKKNYEIFIKQLENFKLQQKAHFISQSLHQDTLLSIEQSARILMDFSNKKVFSINSVIFKQDEPVNEIYLIKKGEVELLRSEKIPKVNTNSKNNGNIIGGNSQNGSDSLMNTFNQYQRVSIRLGILSNSEILGVDDILFKNPVRSYTAICLSEVKVFIMKKMVFQKLMTDMPQLQTTLMQFSRKKEKWHSDLIQSYKSNVKLQNENNKGNSSVTNSIVMNSGGSLFDQNQSGFNQLQKQCNNPFQQLMSQSTIQIKDNIPISCNNLVEDFQGEESTACTNNQAYQFPSKQNLNLTGGAEQIASNQQIPIPQLDQNSQPQKCTFTIKKKTVSLHEKNQTIPMQTIFQQDQLKYINNMQCIFNKLLQQSNHKTSYLNNNNLNTNQQQFGFWIQSDQQNDNIKKKIQMKLAQNDRQYMQQQRIKYGVPQLSSVKSQNTLIPVLKLDKVLKYKEKDNSDKQKNQTQRENQSKLQQKNIQGKLEFNQESSIESSRIVTLTDHNNLPQDGSWQTIQRQQLQLDVQQINKPQTMSNQQILNQIQINQELNNNAASGLQLDLGIQINQQQHFQFPQTSINFNKPLQYQKKNVNMLNSPKLYLLSKQNPTLKFSYSQKSLNINNNNNNSIKTPKTSNGFLYNLPDPKLEIQVKNCKNQESCPEFQILDNNLIDGIINNNKMQMKDNCKNPLNTLNSWRSFGSGNNNSTFLNGYAHEKKFEGEHPFQTARIFPKNENQGKHYGTMRDIKFNGKIQ